jgi:hypothetical protein
MILFSEVDHTVHLIMFVMITYCSEESVSCKQLCSDSLKCPVVLWVKYQAVDNDGKLNCLDLT